MRRNYVSRIALHFIRATKLQFSVGCCANPTYVLTFSEFCVEAFPCIRRAIRRAIDTRSTAATSE